MSPRPAALVAVLVVLAGCAGGGVPAPNGDQSSPTSQTETAASAGTNPSGETSPDPPTASDAAGNGTNSTVNGTDAAPNETLPPGVNESGVEDAEAVVAAHRSALNNTSFEFRFRANVSIDPAVQWTVQRGSVEPGFAPLVVHSTSVRQFDDDATQVGTDLWANASSVVVRYRGEESTELRLSNRTGDGMGAYDETWDHLPRADLESQVSQSWLVELALAVGDYRLARTEERDGQSVAVLRATEAVAAANYTDLNATVAVDETGLVREASLTATAEGDDETRIHYEFRLTDVGTATVSQPAWVDAATPPNATGDEETTAATTRNATATADE